MTAPKISKLKDKKVCSVNFCERKSCSLGFCSPHYQRYRKGQNLSIPIRTQAKSVEHGTLSKWTYGCRCEECLEARRIYNHTRGAYIREMLSDYKLLQGCIDCGYNKNSAALEFDHRGASQKLFGIGKGCSDYGIEKLWDEVDKCDVKCCNCHNVKSNGKEASNKSEIRLEVNGYKTANGCVDCGYNKYPTALHFDHIDTKTKKFNIGSQLNKYGVNTIWAEIAKCVIRCGNCHAEKTHPGKGLT